MATTEELLARQEELERALASGVADISYHGQRITYRSAYDLKAALAEVRRQLRGAPVTEVRFTASKGL